MSGGMLGGPGGSRAEETRMRFLMLTTEYPPARGYGLARYAGELATALAATGAEAHVVACNYDRGRPSHTRDGVVVHDRREMLPLKHYDWVGDAVLNNVHLLGRALEVADQAGPFDVVISHDWLAAHAAKALRSILGLPWLLIMHDTEVGKRDNRLARSQLYIAEMEGWATRLADRIVCCSEFMRTELRNRYKCPPEKLEVIPCGVNPSSFEVTAAFTEFRRLLAPDDVRIVLFVGRLSPMKGPDLLVEAIPAILRATRDVRFVFCGDGIAAEALRQRVGDLEVQDGVSFLGHVHGQALAAIYRVADVLVVPSRYEPFGLVALEGAVCGLPALTSGAGGLSEIAAHEDSVEVLPENTSEAIASACLKALARGAASPPRQIVPPHERHRWPSVAKSILDVLSGLIKGRPRSDEVPPSQSGRIAAEGATARTQEQGPRVDTT